MSFPKQPPVTRTSSGGSEAVTLSDDSASSGSQRIASTPAVRRGSVEPKSRSCCCVCCAAICSCLGHDRIYGSFIGPHPVNFMWCCCSCCCKGTCLRPFALASITTKLMWFLMLFFISALACFFIIPYPQNERLDAVGHFWPCGHWDWKYSDMSNTTKIWIWNGKNVSDNLSHSCKAHGGYFMVYRVFLSYIILLLFHCLLLIGVKSVNNNPLRAKIHHGFWFYKYFCLVALLLVCFLAIRVEMGGIFEYIMSWTGLIGSLVFSFIELTMILDIVELFITSNKNSKSDWADCCFWFVTVLVIIIDIVLIVLIGVFYLVKNTLRPDPIHDRYTVTVGVSLSLMHLLIYLYGIFLTVGIIGITIWTTTRRGDAYGILRSLFVIAYLQGLIWGTLSVSPEVDARPHYNMYKSASTYKLQDGNEDTYFKSDGCFQGLSCIITLMYYLFWHGPRSKNAPLSILFDRIWYWKAEKPVLPVVPQELSSYDEDQYTTAVEQFKVWEDERLSVRYSWTIFYVIMILASLTLMMSMTNFSDPWAIQWYCSSRPAVGIKLVATLFITGLYLLVTFTITSKVGPDEEKRKSLGKLPEDEESTYSDETAMNKRTSITKSKAPSKRNSANSARTSEAPVPVAATDSPVNNNPFLNGT